MESYSAPQVAEEGWTLAWRGQGDQDHRLRSRSVPLRAEGHSRSPLVRDRQIAWDPEAEGVLSVAE